MDTSKEKSMGALSAKAVEVLLEAKERRKKEGLGLGRWVSATVNRLRSRKGEIEKKTMWDLVKLLQLDLTQAEALDVPKAWLAEFFASGADSRDEVVSATGVGLEQLPRVKQLFGPAEGVAKRLVAGLASPLVRAVGVLGAIGGIGKSGLVSHFLRNLAHPAGERPVEYFVYGFNDRRRHGNPSTEDFFHRALVNFGSNGPPHWSARSLADQLCDVLEQRDVRLVLVLDGLETLQRPLSPQLGEFLQVAAPLGVFLRRYTESTTASRGLCVLTSRLGVVELADSPGYQELPLDRLERRQGAEFLRQMGVEGTTKQLGDASEHFGGHLLSLHLLAAYLRDWADGQIGGMPSALSRSSVESRLASNSPAELPSAEQLSSRMNLTRFDGIMQCFIERHSGHPLELLRLLSLFDGAVSISGLANILGAVESELRSVVEQLAPSGVLQRWPASGNAPTSVDGLTSQDTCLDLHPWVREFIAKEFSTAQTGNIRLNMQRRIRDAFLAKSSRIADYTDVQNLHAAVLHGCRAGEVRQAFWNYWSRLADEDPATGEARFSSLRRFGRFGDELELLGSFYLSPWNQLHPALDERARGLLLGVTGYCARANGDLPLSRQLLQNSFDVLRAFGNDPVHTCRVAGALSESLRSLGELREAHSVISEAVGMANRLGYCEAQVDKVTTLADILHFQGNIGESQRCFTAAQDLAGGELKGIPSVRWCELLLTLGRFSDVVRQATRALETHSIESDLLPGALHTLYLGVSCMHVAGQDAVAREHGHHCIERGLSFLQMAGMLEHQAMGHILVAELHLKSGEYEAAANSLLAARSSGQLQAARLIKVDWLLTAIDLHLANPATDILRRAHLGTAPDILEELLPFVREEYGLRESRAVDLQLRVRRRPKGI